MKSNGAIKIVGDAYAGFYSCGLTMLDNATMKTFTQVQPGCEGDGTRLYERPDGLQLKIAQTLNKETSALEIQTSIINNSDNPVTLELLTSFVLENIKADKIHRFTSFWSAEGRHKVDTVKELNLEQAWNKMALRIEKFGNVGSMPVRRYFPFVALEDSETGTFTGVQLHCAGSWQIELICQHEDALTVAGGLADGDFGAWTKVLNPGEELLAPKAVAATGKSLEEVCDKLVKSLKPDISSVDNHMGIVFNEYCTTWGNPTSDNLKKIVDKLSEKAAGKIQYLVIDAGWYGGSNANWWETTGDWSVNRERFPKGLKDSADYIRSKGMIPGIWFEFENLAPKSALWNETDHLLKKFGKPLTVGERRFLDMEDPWVINHLSENVIGTLKDNGFGYIKVDYNDTFGLGCDGEVECNGFGENLRRKILGTHAFFKKMKKEIPELVIENCSSGGHRLEPGFMELSTMASFSDAHEILSLPLIAANLQRLVLPEQNQIWSVMRKTDSDARIFYSICATFLGRMGLSGDIYELSDHQWMLVNTGMDFYNRASGIIRSGKTVLLQSDVESYNEPQGNQLVVRLDEKAGEGLIIFHRFKQSLGLEDYLQKLGDTLPAVCKNLEERVLEHYGNADQDFSAQSFIISL